MSFLQPSPLAFHGRAFDEDVMTRSTAAGVNRPLRRTSEASSDPALISRLMRLIRDPVALAADFKEDLWDTLDLDARDEDETSAEKRKQALRAALKNASTYEDWRSWAGQLDHLEGHEAWKVERDSSEYDVELVQSRLEQLDAARAACDLDRMLFLVRTSLTRGLGDMGNVRLYRHSHIGTKALIESYINSTLETLKTILALSARASYKAMDTRHMLEQVLAARQAFGRSAMLLSGGAMLGLNHIGVLKALWENQLLPRIISGASAGSIVAAVLCTHPDEEIPAILRDFPYRELSLFDQEDGGVLRRLGRLLKVGALLDVNYLSDALRDFLGEMTFQEAYNRTRRILNICVSSASIYEIPRLLNYVTAPNVLIWSAVAASCSVPVLFGSASILTKDPKTGEAVPWNSSPLRYIDGSVDNDLPITRLAEMFNVNHFIVSQVNPHVIPFLARDDDVIATDVEHKIGDGPGWMYSAMELAKAEALHRMHVLAELGIFPNALTKARSVLSQKYSGDITIVPEISYADFPRILQNPTPDFVRQAMLTGERATWPKLSRVRNHCAVELALDDAVQQLRARVVFSPSQVDLRRMHTLPGTMTPTTSAPKVVSSKVAGTINERRRRRPASMLDEPEASGDDDGWLMVVAAPRNRSPFRLGLGQGHPSHPAASFSSLTPSNSRGRGGTVSAAAAVPPPSSQHVLQPSSDPIPSTSDLSRSPPSYSSSHVDNDDDGCDPLSASSSASSSGSPSFSYFPRASRSTGKSQAVFPNVSQPATPNIGSGRAWQMAPSALHVDRPPAAPAVSSSPSTVTAQPSPWRRTETYVPGKIAHHHASPLTATDPVNTTGSFRSAGGSSASLARSSYPAGSKSPASASASVPVPTGSSLPAKARPGSSEPRYKRIFHRTIKQQR